VTESGETAARPPVAWEIPGSAGPSTATGGQPMSSGDIFQSAIELYQRGFVIIVTVAAVVQIPLAIVAAITGARVANAFAPLLQAVREGAPQGDVQSAFQNAFSQSSGSFGTYGLVAFLAGLLLSPALIATTARLYARSKPTVGEAYGKALGAAISILIGSIVQGIVLFLVFIGILVAGIVVAVVLQNEPALVALAVFVAFILAFVAVAYLAIRWSVWSVAVVLEGHGPLDALRRSWGLVRGNMWRALAIIFVTGLVASVAGAVFGAVGEQVREAVSPGAGTFVRDLLSILTVSWLPIVLTLLFLDLRARQGGPMMAATTMAGTTMAAAPMAAAPMSAPPPEAAWPTTPQAAVATPEPSMQTPLADSQDAAARTETPTSPEPPPASPGELPPGSPGEPPQSPS